MSVEIPVTKNIFGNRHGGCQSQRKRKQISDMLLERENCSDQLWNYKVAPAYQPAETETRYTPRCCKYCLPDSELSVLGEIKYFGLVDCLSSPMRQPDTFDRFRKWHKLPTWKELENDKKLLSLYSTDICKDPVLHESKKMSVLETLAQLQVYPIHQRFPNIFSRLFSLCVWMTKRYLAYFFEEVLVHEGQIGMIKDLQSTNLPIVYVPTYRSSFDKSILLLVMANYGLQMPVYIPGYNDNYTLTSITGGIGPPKLTPASNYDEDLKYSSALAAYFRGLLKSRNGIILNFESKRSRSGKPSPHVYGTEFLGIIQDEFDSEVIEDAHFVPVALSYESIPDSNEIFSDFSYNQKSASLMNVFFKIISSVIGISRPKGKVRIDFSQPVCFRQIHQSLLKNTKVLRAVAGDDTNYAKTSDCSYLKWSSTESLNSVSPLYGTLGPLYPSTEEKVEVILDLFCHHLLYDAWKCESIMPNHLLAFILVKKFKGGAYLDQLKVEMKWLIGIIKSVQKDFGFYMNDCDAQGVVLRGVELLQKDLMIDWISGKQTYKITPKGDSMNLRRLEYNANSIFPIFMMEAIISVAIFSICGSQLTILQGLNVEIHIKDEELLRRCKRIYQYFAGGFLLHPPCLTCESAIRMEVSKMADNGLLSLKMRSTKSYVWEDDEYDDYDCEGAKESIPEQDFVVIPEAVKVLHTADNFKRLDFARSLLLPYFEVYSFLMKALRKAFFEIQDPKQIETSKLHRFLLNELLTTETTACLQEHRQLISMDTVKAFLVTCENKCVIETFHGDEGTNKSFYSLNETWAKRKGKKLKRLAATMLSYLIV